MEHVYYTSMKSDHDHNGFSIVLVLIFSKNIA